jgi:hypothetical protein
MKKGIFLLFFLLCILFLNGQLINSYGLKTGLCMANQDFDFSNEINWDLQTRYGMRIGLFLELFENASFNLLLETSYAQKGMNVEFDMYSDFEPTNNTITFNNRVDYLEFSIFGKYAVNLSKLKPYFLVGPRIDFLLGYKSEKGAFDEVYKKFESVDFGFSIALGLEIQLIKKYTFLFEGRYSPTMTNSYKTDILEIKNQSIDLLTGFKF